MSGMTMGACLVANEPDGLTKALLDARVQGKSWKTIADEFGYANPSAARSAFKKATGISDFKIKGPAVKDLWKTQKSGIPNAGKVDDLADAAKKALAPDPATFKQVQYLEDLIEQLDVSDVIKYDATTLTKKEASDLIDELLSLKNPKSAAGKIDEIKKLTKELYGGYSDDAMKVLDKYADDELDAYLQKLKDNLAKKKSQTTVGNSPAGKAASKKIDQPFDYKTKPKPDYLYDGDILEALENGDTYQAIAKKFNKTIAEIDDINWNRLLKKHDGNVWEAFKAKPTSVNAEKAVKKLVSDARAAGKTWDEIKAAMKLDDSTLKALKDGTWTKSPPGSYSYTPPPSFGSYAEPPSSYGTPSYSSEPITVGNPVVNFPKGDHSSLIDWVKDDILPANQLNAVKKYTGSYYGQINGSLRRGAIDPDVDSLVKKIDKSFRPTPDDIHVVRGTRTNVFGGADPSDMIGQVFEDKGYMSTSVGSGFGGDYVFFIDVPKGTPARYVDNISLHSGERELLLARGTKFIVEGVKKKGTRWEIYMRVIGHGVTG